MKTAGNVLVTCGGKWVGMVVQLRRAMRELAAMRRAKIFVADRATVTPAGHFADSEFVVPAIAEPDYIDVLLEICRENRVGVVVPLIDVDLMRLAPHGRRFAEIGTRLVSPPVDVAELCFDKAKFAAFAESAEIPAPRAYASVDLHTARFPLFCKPARGFGSRGSGVCRSLADARKMLKSHPEVMFQQYVEAPELSVDGYVAANGKCTVCVQRIRDKVIGGEAVQTHTVRLPKVRELSARTIDALSRRGLRGPFNLQVFVTDEPMVIEVNPRLGSASVLSNVASRGRLLRCLLAESCGLPAGGDPDDYREGVYLSRYLGDLIHNGNGFREVFPAEKAK